MIGRPHHRLGYGRFRLATARRNPLRDLLNNQDTIITIYLLIQQLIIAYFFMCLIALVPTNMVQEKKKAPVTDKKHNSKKAPAAAFFSCSVIISPRRPRLLRTYRTAGIAPFPGIVERELCDLFDTAKPVVSVLRLINNSTAAALKTFNTASGRSPESEEARYRFSRRIIYTDGFPMAQRVKAVYQPQSC
jgi:hypothetical protein